MTEWVIEKGLSVRELERLIHKAEKRPTRSGQKDGFPELGPDDDWIKELIRRFQTRIKVKRKKRGGAIEIHFHSDEELIRIVDLLLARRSIESD